MSKIDLRAYHRALALYCLGQRGAPCTAAELAEHMGALAMSEGHPKGWWSDISPSSVAGHLRTLENGSNVDRVGDRPNPRHGRGEPLWRFAGEQLPRCPDPGDFETEDAPPPRQSPAPSLPAAPAPALPPLPAEREAYAEMTRDQLLTVLRINDEVAGAAKRFINEILDISERGRRALLAVGVEMQG